MKKKYKLVICNKADNEKCPKCSHSLIHNRKGNDQFCTEWETCYDTQGEPVFKVRCVSIASNEGIRVLNNLDKY